MVRLLGIEDLFLRDRLRLARAIELLEEAALEAGVAGAADLLHLKEERVASQSLNQRTTLCVCPLVSPLSQNFFRDRLQ